MRRDLVWLFVLLLASFAAPSAHAVMDEDQFLFDMVPTVNARFGSAIAADGPWALIGAPGDEGFTGSAYFWFFAPSTGNWAGPDKVKADVPDEDAQFGRAVAISGDVLVTAAFQSPTSKVAVYRFNGSTWEKEQDLPFVGTGAITVAVSGDVIAVKARPATALVRRSR